VKSLQKIIRVKLNTNQIDGSVLLGIVSAEPDYKLSITLNRIFRISLKNISPIKIPFDNENDLAFSRFSYTNCSPDITYNLISNRSGNHFLLKKLKNVDYILLLQDFDNETNIEWITSNLREMDSITAVFSIDLKIIKDKNLQFLIH
jgi:hypothetical protein